MEVAREVGAYARSPDEGCNRAQRNIYHKLIHYKELIIIGKAFVLLRVLYRDG